MEVELLLVFALLEYLRCTAVRWRGGGGMLATLAVNRYCMLLRDRFGHVAALPFSPFLSIATYRKTSVVAIGSISVFFAAILGLL